MTSKARSRSHSQWPKPRFLSLLLAGVALIFLAAGQDPGKSLFDGRSFSGWEGHTDSVWRIEDGMIVGGSLSETVPRNEFLTTKDSYDDFILTFKIKLIGTDGFINSGVQIRSKRASDPENEMIGYQADWGTGYWASLYDESRRNKTLVAPDSTQVMQWIDPDGWNDYKIHAEGRRIQLFINGHRTVDYREPDSAISQEGLIGLQIHGGGKAEVYFKDIMLKEL